MYRTIYGIGHWLHRHGTSRPDLGCFCCPGPWTGSALWSCGDLARPVDPLAQTWPLDGDVQTIPGLPHARDGCLAGLGFDPTAGPLGAYAGLVDLGLAAEVVVLSADSVVVGLKVTLMDELGSWEVVVGIGVAVVDVVVVVDVVTVVDIVVHK